MSNRAGQYHFFPVFGSKKEIKCDDFKLKKNKPAYIEPLIGYNVWRPGEYMKFLTLEQYNQIHRKASNV